MGLYERCRWIKWLSDPLMREGIAIGLKSDQDPQVAVAASPMTIKVGDQTWTFATDGNAFFILKAAMPWKLMEADQADLIRPFLNTVATGRITDLASFKKWIGQGWRSGLPCRSCGGDWARRCATCWGKGIKRGACARCGMVHDCCCPHCEEGYTYCDRCAGAERQKIRPGQVGHVVFDRARLARYLAQVEDIDPGKNVFIEVNDSKVPLLIESEKRLWRVGIMPLREPSPGTVSTWRLA